MLCVPPFDLSGRHVHSRQTAEFLGITTGTQDAVAWTKSTSLRVVRRHIQALIVVRNKQRVLAGMVRHRPVPFRVVCAHDMAFVILLEDGIPIDRSLARGSIDAGNMKLG